jgi:hypothetical protein
MLALQGWDASPTPGNTPRTDILAQHHEHQTLIAVQCKTKSGKGYFLLNEGCESPSLPGRNEWFVLVALNGQELPDFYIVPRNVIAAYLHVSYRSWLDVPAKNGEPHKENTMRNVEVETVHCYRGRWELLEQPAESAPHWLPTWVFDWGDEHGLPDGIPALVRPGDGVMSAEVAASLPYWLVPHSPAEP